MNTIPTLTCLASLILSLQAYGYTNVYELGLLLDIGKTRIPFQGSDVDENGRPLMMRITASSFHLRSNFSALPTR